MPFTATAPSATLNGLTIGGASIYRFSAYPTGLGTPEIRTDDRVRPRRAGIVAASDLLGARQIAFEVEIRDPDRSALEQALSDLNAAFAPTTDDVWLTVHLTGVPSDYSILGRPRGVEWDLSRRFTFGFADARASFVATDPLKYGTEVVVSLPLPTGSSGIVAPVVAPVVSGASAGGEVTFSNSGTAAVDWTATLTGPMSTPRLEHVGLSRRVSFDIDLATGETLVLDSRTGSALLNGVTPRTSTQLPGSRWWQLPVGSSTLRLRASSGSGDATIRYRPGFQ